MSPGGPLPGGDIELSEGPNAAHATAEGERRMQEMESLLSVVLESSSATGQELAAVKGRAAEMEVKLDNISARLMRIEERPPSNPPQSTTDPAMLFPEDPFGSSISLNPPSTHRL